MTDNEDLKTIIHKGRMFNLTNKWYSHQRREDDFEMEGIRFFRGLSIEGEKTDENVE